MTALTIRDVSEDAVRTMKIRAAQAGQSLQAYLRSLIEREAARPTVAEAVEQARRQATADISTTGILAAIDPVRDPLLHPRSRRLSDRSGANHGPRGRLVALSLAIEYARRGVRVSAEITGEIPHIDGGQSRTLSLDPPRK
jgi:plasmid stability protein